MADDTPTPASAAAPEPEPAAEPGDDIEFLPSGVVNMTIAGVKYRLERPDKLGALKRLRMALELVTDTIDDASYDAERVAAEVGRALEAASKLSPEEQDRLAPEHLELRRKAKGVSRQLVEVADDARMKWWTLVFELLAKDSAGRSAMPDDLPAWMVDINLPGQIMQHWRSAPLARGR